MKIKYNRVSTLQQSGGRFTVDDDHYDSVNKILINHNSFYDTICRIIINQISVNDNINNPVNKKLINHNSVDY